MSEEKKTGKIGFVNKSKFTGSFTGTLYWEDEKFKLADFVASGNIRRCNVKRKNGKKYVAKNGVEYDSYDQIGAMWFDIEKGTGEVVLELIPEMPTKYLFTTELSTDSNGEPVRKLKFAVSEHKLNKYHSMFDNAPVVTSETPELPKGAVNDDIPF